MSTPTSPRPEPGAPEALPAPAASSWSVWILTVWHPALGLAVDPVAVLALDSAPDADPQESLVWVPLVYDEGNPWRERLADGITEENLTRWQAESGVCQIAQAEIPEGAVDLRHAAELVLDELLAEVIPALPPRAGV
ncbi:hypothetical protein OG689_44525 [Kitasatospora sp. NBC_00240]|uniref:hypothetical protein n=1 Tax=Kitasatospora sp. NBC_00240 TaxID=2903567 RepID=UPI002252A203|nr:hypothetical protein [Kitasatospora sp. NBC_00240]MCX5216205.1 hypothetical protein [Kitasatospora sp. NBC_00240]